MGIEKPSKSLSWMAFCMSEWYHHHIPATPSIAYLVVCVQVLLRRAALGAAIFHALLILKNDLHKTLDTPFDGKGHQRLQS